MFKKLVNKRVLKNEKGLTLIELLAVIVILAIVAAIAIPAIGNIIDNSRYNAVKSDGINVINASNLYFTDNPDKNYVTAKDLKDDGYLESAGKIPLDAAAATAEATSKSYVKIVSGEKQLTTENITITTGKKIKFTSNGVDSINKDTTKGKDLTDTVHVVGN